MAAVIALAGNCVFAAGIIAVASVSIRQEEKTTAIRIPRPNAVPARLPCAQAPGHHRGCGLIRSVSCQTSAVPFRSLGGGDD
jgi:hypothetical protein